MTGQGRICIYRSERLGEEEEYAEIEVPEWVIEEALRAELYTETGTNTKFVHIGPIKIQIFIES